MSHVDYFKEFFRIHRRGTAVDICQYLVNHGAEFNCAPERRCVSVNSHLRRECDKVYPTGVVTRELNKIGIYEYFTV